MADLSKCVKDLKITVEMETESGQTFRGSLDLTDRVVPDELSGGIRVLGTGPAVIGDNSPVHALIYSAMRVAKKIAILNCDCGSCTKLKDEHENFWYEQDEEGLWHNSSVVERQGRLGT